MITLIIGQNAIGKSVYITAKAKESALNKRQMISNISEYGEDGYSYLYNRPYNEDRLEVLSEVFDTDDIEQTSEYLMLRDAEIPISKNLNTLLTLICKEGKELYLDEPEYALSNGEINYLVSFIYNIMHTFECIEIVTHSEIFLSIVEAERKTIKLNHNNEYVLTDLEKSAYETID